MFIPTLLVAMTMGLPQAYNCQICLREIPPQAGAGFSWVEANATDCGFSYPKWKVSNPGSIAPFSYFPDIAVFGGPTGLYQVCVEYDKGTACIYMYHEILEP